MHSLQDEAKVRDLLSLALKIARRLCQDITGADDLAGEAMMLCVENRRILDKPPAYQRTVFLNLFRRRMKGERRRKKEEAECAAAAEIEGPLAAQLRVERARLLLAAMEELPGELLEVLDRRVVLGQSYHQISQDVGKPISTLQERYQRAIALLRQRLEARLGSPAAIVAWLAPLATLGPVGRPLAFRRLTVTAIAAACLVVATLWWGLSRAGEAPVAIAAAAAAQPDPPPVVEVRDALVRQEVPRGNEPDPDVVSAASTLLGRVLDIDATPAANCSVLLLSFDAMHLGIAGDPFGVPVPPPFTTQRTHTDEAGNFELGGIAPRAHLMLVLDPDGPQRTLRPVDLTLSIGEVIDAGDLHLVLRGGVTGRVVDEGLRPVRGATVWVADVPGVAGLAPLGAVARATHVLFRDRVAGVPPWIREVPAWLGIPFTRTDDEGRFALEGVALGPNLLVTSADGLLDDVRSIVVARGRPLAVGDIGLDDEVGAVELVVRNQAGASIGHAEVVAGPDWSLPILGSDRMLQPLTAQASTGQDGKTTLHGIGKAGFVVAARRGSNAPWHLARARRGSRSVTVTLPEEQSIRLRLIDENGQPITDGKFALVDGDAGRVELGLGLAHARSLSLRVDAEGTWTGVAELGADDELLVCAPGHRALSVPARELVGPEQRRLSDRRPVVLRVRSPDGRAVAGAEVYVLAARSAAPSPQLLQGLADHWTSPPRFLGCTDRDGELAGGVDLDGPTWLVVVAPGHPPWARTLEPSAAPIEVELVPASRLRAEVARSDSTATQDLRVVVSADWREPSGMPVEQWLRQLDANGRLDVKDLVAERDYMIGIRRGLRELTSLGEIVRRAMSPDNVFKARLRRTIPSGSCHMSLDLAPLQPGERTAAVTVTGTLTVDGRVADNCTLRLLAETGLWDSSRDGFDLPLTTGRFSFTSIAQLPSYVLELHRTDARERLWRRPLQRGDSLDLQVEHDLALTTLEGQCTDADGAAVAFVDLVLLGTLGTGPSGRPDTARVEVRTTSAGGLRTRLAPGMYVIEGANARSQPFAVTVPWTTLSARLVGGDAERRWLVSAQ